MMHYMPKSKMELKWIILEVTIYVFTFYKKGISLISQHVNHKCKIFYLKISSQLLIIVSVTFITVFCKFVPPPDSLLNIAGPISFAKSTAFIFDSGVLAIAFNNWKSIFATW